MKASELRQLTRDELLRKLNELRDEQFKLKLRRGGEELPNPVRLRLLRRDIARCLTVLRALETPEAKPVETKNG